MGTGGAASAAPPVFLRLWPPGSVGEVIFISDTQVVRGD